MNIATLKKMFFAVLAALAVAGCATERIDWAARVGHYTYNQAVNDFGPPDKSARLTDGTTVAEWMTERGEIIVAPEGPYFVGPHRYFGPAFVPDYSETYFPGRYLRLTFGADGTLTAEKELAK
jgi:hypothetical protein